MGIKISGLKELEAQLKSFGDRARKLDGTHNMPISELLSPGFLQRCSRFNSVEDLFAASGFSIKNTDDFKAIPYEEWDAFIRNNTNHGSWKEMLASATAEWTKERLGL